MPPVIKAQTDFHGQSVAFNFDDLASEAEAYLKRVRAQAEQIVAKAAQEAIAVRKAAEAEGRQAGMKTIETMIDQKMAKQLETVLPALRAAVAEIEQSKHAWLGHWEKEVVHLAAAMAARVCRKEAIRDPQVTLNLLKEALELAGSNASVRILLDPDDHAALAHQVDSLVKEFSRIASAAVVADPHISRGGCRVETEFGMIDQQFESQLARMEEELIQ